MNMHQYMSKKQRKKAKKFADKHYKQCASSIHYIVTPTGIGEALDIYCDGCDTLKDLTEYERW